MTIQRTHHVGVVVDDLATAIALFAELGLESHYGATYRLCYVRGPEGIIVELAERTG